MTSSRNSATASGLPPAESFLRNLCLAGMLVLGSLLTQSGLAAMEDLRIFPFANGECAETPDGALVTNIGTPFVHKGDTGCEVTKTNVQAEVHSGNGAFQVNVSTAQRGFAFFSLSMHGFGPDASYWQSRDLSRISEIEFWFDNRTGKKFTLKIELKDHRDDSDHILSQRVTVPAAAGWRKYRAVISNMTRTGTPDLHRMRFAALVFEEISGQQVVGNVFFDDMNFREQGKSISLATASDSLVSYTLARRMFLALWGSRDREHGLVPLNSAFADISAINATGGLIALLPVAVERNWLSRPEADAYVAQLCDTLQTLMLSRVYLPARYVESRTLAPVGNEESSVDGAIIALALLKYRAFLAGQNPSLAQQINSTLNKFNFKPFFAAGQGFHHAFLIEEQVFTAGVYDSYSSEVYVLALAARLAGAQRVSLQNSWNTGTHRVRLGEGAGWFVVAETEEYRSPFMQYLFNLFVRTSDRPADSYPVASLRRNPWVNAQLYQRFVIDELTALNRPSQPDAGINLAGQYESCSLWRGSADLHHPWSADAYEGLADMAWMTGDKQRAAIYDSLSSQLLRKIETYTSGDTNLSFADEDDAVGSVEATLKYWNRRLRTLNGRAAGTPEELLRIGTCHQQLRDAYTELDRLDQAEQHADQYVALLKAMAEQNWDQNELNRPRRKPGKPVQDQLDSIEAMIRLAAIRKKQGDVDKLQEILTEIELELERVAKFGNNDTQARRSNQLQLELRELSME